MLLAGLAIVLTAGGAAVYWIEASSLTRQFDAGLTARAQTLASLVKREPQALVFETSDAPEATIAETYFELRTREGRVLKRSANLGQSSLGGRDLNEGETAYAPIELPAGMSGRAIWLAFLPRIDPEDWEERDPQTAEQELLIVAAALDRAPIDRALTTLLAALVSVGAATAAAGAMLVALGVRWGLAPLHRLSRQVGAVDGRTVGGRLDDSGAPRELVPVYRELNRMLDRVGQTLERERSFAGAAAHELRTPLAELRTIAEVALRWPDADRAAAALRELLAIGGEMERLVESLLLISRGNTVPASDAPVSGAAAPIAAIVRDCLQRSAGAIRDKDLTLSIELHGHETLPAPRDAVDIILRNLIENAVQYTPPRGSITIRDGLAPDRTAALSTLVIENGPVQLREADLPRMFEPFWRLERSRSDRAHAGLGLAIVRHVAAAVGLRVDAGLSGDRLRIHVAGPG
jgi:two-component system sensor histidine kinase QseC